jgi:predicted CoA-binding protein
VSVYVAPNAQERLAILRRTRSIAIVGMSADPSKASYFVATYLLSSSCSFEHVWFVNPRGGEIMGRPVYRSLAELPGVPDMVDVFRKPADLPAVAEEVIAIPGTSTFWAQLGLESVEAAAIAEGAGRRVVMNRCLKIEHARFAGGLHLAGFDTGVISSRRRGGV